MPTYDYVCDACQHSFEQWQSFHDEHLTKCPSCKKKKLRRLIGTGAAIVFKGSGFYETDYNRGEDYQAKAKADAEAATPKADTATDTPSTGSSTPAASETPAPAPASTPKPAAKKSSGKPKK
jgi:putative FmdB family regulatory protein